MHRTLLNVDNFHRANHPVFVALALISIWVLPSYSTAQQPGQKTFSSAEAASKAWVTAVQSNDEKAMLEILGQNGKQVISSGDSVEDAEHRASFVQRYEEMHRLVREPDGTTTLYIGAKNWPAPIPLMKKGNAWYFDTEAGKWEILRRRIGRNEMSAIRICKELVAAEREYHATQQNGYAQKIISDVGQRNGLYWKASEGEPQSPIGPLVASAVAEGYVKEEGAPPTPYRGYYYRTLKRQGKDAPGGGKDYIVNGQMTGGFAFVAYPAEYRSSGVMTFIVNEEGIVFQKDLGDKTEAVAKAMVEYNPGSGWRRAEDEAEETGGEAQSKYQTGTITAVQSHRAADPSSPNTYEVSLQVGNTVYVTLYKPRFDTGIVPYEVGRELNVLVSGDTITVNDMLGNSFQVPILSHAPVTQ